MKKKVRYAAGIVGAAVPALGLMMPAAASATAQKPAAGGKTVTLLQYHDAAVAAAGCTGKTKVVATNKDNSVLKFYWTPEFAGTSNGACIGTVEGRTALQLVTASSYWRVRIYGHTRSGHKEKQYSHHVHAPIPGLMENSHSFSIGIHSVFGALPVQVCMAPEGPIVPASIPATCHSVT